MIKAVCFFALLAVAFAQTPQTGPLSVTTLVPGVVTSGSLLPTASSATAYHVQLYSFWVPENVSSVNLTFTDTDTTACSYISVYLSTYGLPCSDDEYNSNYQCANAWDIGNGIYSYSDVYTPYDDNYLFHYDVNQYWYVAVGKYYSSDYDETCTYQLSLSYNSTCPTGSVGVADSSSSTVCEAYTVATPGTTYTVLNGNPTGNNDFTVYKINVPTATVGHIFVTVNSTSSDLDLYGRNYAGASTYTDYTCYEYTYTTVGNFYIYEMFCYTPRLGDFFVTIDTDDTNWNGTVNFAMVTCAAGTAGANCSFPLYPFNTSLLVAPTSLTIPYTGGSSVEYGSIYFYWDIPANYSAGDIVLFANSVGSGYLQIRRNGFPTSDSGSGYEYYSEYDSYDATLALNQFDYQTAGRVYFMLNCYTSPSCNVTVSLNATQGSTSAAVTTAAPGPQVTTAAPVPTPTTGVRFTTGLTTAFVSGAVTTAAASESSSAIAVVPSIFALAAALFAML